MRLYVICAVYKTITITKKRTSGILGTPADLNQKESENHHPDDSKKNDSFIPLPPSHQKCVWRHCSILFFPRQNNGVKWRYLRVYAWREYTTITLRHRRSRRLIPGFFVHNLRTETGCNKASKIIVVDLSLRTPLCWSLSSIYQHCCI